MMLSRTLILAIPAACLLAQTPTPKPAAPAYSPSVAPDKVVVSVGDVKLTASQFNSLIELLPEQNRSAARGERRKEFADEVVKVLVLADEGRRRKMDETPAYKVQEAFQTANLLAGKAFAVLGVPEEAELRKYYDAHKSEYDQVRARHILIRAAGSPMAVLPGRKELSDEEALAKAKELRQKIVDGADMTMLATKESDDTGSIAKGGDVDFFSRGTMVPPFDDAAFSLKVGELSQPVKSPFGYHIIRVEERKTKPFEEVRSQIERTLGAQHAQTAVDDLVKKANVTLDPEFFATAPPPDPSK